MRWLLSRCRFIDVGSRRWDRLGLMDGIKGNEAVEVDGISVWLEAFCYAMRFLEIFVYWRSAGAGLLYVCDQPGRRSW